MLLTVPSPTICRELPSASTVGIGVIGYGYWGPNLLRNFMKTAGAEVVGVSDLDPARLLNAKKLAPGIRETTDFKDLLSDLRVDAVAIATPVHTHFDIAMAALRSGKHVLVEKPLAQTSAQARQLVDEAARRGRVLMVDHTFIYTPAVQKIRDLIRERVVGDVYYYNSTRASLGLFQPDVNVIWDLAVHDMSIIQHILTNGPIAVSATGVSHVAGSPENMAHVALFFSDSCIAHISVNWLSPIKIRQILIGGSSKMIMYDDLEATEKIKVYDKGVVTLSGSEKDVHQLKVGYRAGDMWAPHLPAKEALESEAEHFVDCIRRGDAPMSNGTTGLQVVQILEAASKSIAAQGAPISLHRS
ncbi:MAG TPA: Gfo/Idh/MocA family oxidoreductase [Pseudolabrys sp.]|nr:Gfo/Idh/MocA family oxidoreductase [Pseudolabrys sp.]